MVSQLHRILIRPLCALLVCSVSVINSANAQQASSDETVRVQLDTSEGAIVLELNAAKAPKTVENFLKYVEQGHYAGTIFHRVIDGFMIQGGGFDKEMKEKSTNPPVRNEAGNGLRNDKYTIAMARTNDPHSATSQFFINTVDNAMLNRAQSQDGFGYTVFGKVVEGMEVVDRIGKTPTRAVPNPRSPAMLMQDVPATPVVIEEAKKVAGK